MINNKNSITISICVCYFLSVVLVGIALTGPWLFKLYLTSYRGFVPDGAALEHIMLTTCICFYSCAAFAAAILISLLKMLYNIKKEQVFIMQNVNCLKIVSWSCFTIAAITFVGGFFYMPIAAIAAAAIFVGILLRVLKNVMQSAVELREENDLTI